MRAIPHPSEYLAQDQVAAIRLVAGQAEQMKQLHPEQLAIIYEQKWFQLFVPKHYKGLELALPEALQLEEALAWTDGSVGWTVTLCAGAGWFIGFLNPEIAKAVFSKNTVCLAGSGKSSGIAKVIDDGYEISGYWDYASGADIATAFTANCLMEENGVALKNADGSPVIMPFLFMKDEVTVHESWKTMGMIATGSNSFETRGLKVKPDRAFHIDERNVIINRPVYHYPFLQFAETTLAVNSSGMALRFLDLCKMLFEEKTMLHTVLNAASKTLEDARQTFYRTVYDSWAACSRHLTISPHQLEKISHASRQLASISRKAVDDLYPLCGMKAANPETEINRVWRNLHTASQHSLLSGARETL